MNEILEKLRAYYRDTPQHQIDADWEACQEFDKIGPTIKEFLQESASFQNFNMKLSEQPEYLYENLKSEVFFGFFLYSKN